MRAAVSLAVVAVFVGGALGCSGPYRTARIEARARDHESGTIYFVEIRRGRDVPGQMGDELNTADEVTAVIVCNDRTPEVCIRVVPESMSSEEVRAWAQHLNATIAAEETTGPER